MVILDFDSEPAARKRMASPGARLSREAAILVRPFNEQLGGWQSEAVRLAAHAQRMRASGRHEPAVTEAIATQLDYVEAQAARFEAAVEAAPPDVRTHSRVVDTRRAFVMVAQRLRDALRKP